MAKKIFFVFLFLFTFSIETFAQSSSGNANSDNKVNCLDFAVLYKNYGLSLLGPSNGDFDNNGTINKTDYAFWASNYAALSSPLSSPTPTRVASLTPTPTRTPSPTPLRTPSPAPPSPTSPPGTSFNFISWSDTETSLATFAQLSNQAIVLQPEFTIYNGDAEAGTLDQWQAALNGNTGNGMSGKTFVVRGNGNSGASGWSTFFNFNAVASNIGAANYTALTANMTYSFDYGNSRFIGIDVLGCADLITTAQVNWAEQRLTDAESRGLTHVFLFMHGSIYYVNNHTECTPPSNLVSVISNHPIVTATFHGHEHTKSYIHFGPTDSRLSMSHNYEQIVSGGAGGGTYPCATARHTANDYCGKFEGFAEVTISGRTVTVSFYQVNSSTPVKTINFTK